MKLFSYVVARDYGFAPNPFFGTCTLATCKPRIRKTAKVGDWIVGTGSQKYGLRGKVVYVMQVAEVLSFDQYWNEPRFVVKRPRFDSSIIQAFGDNIYHENPISGEWIQENSHHSLADGTPNSANIRNDTQTDRMLIGHKFIFWGDAGPLIPQQLREKICCGRGHKSKFSEADILTFIKRIQSLGESGYVNPPSEMRVKPVIKRSK